MKWMFGIVFFASIAGCTAARVPEHPPVPAEEVANARRIIEPLQRMLEATPDQPALLHLLASSPAKTGQHDEAADVLERLAEHPAWTLSVDRESFPGVFENRRRKDLLTRLESRVPHRPAGRTVFRGAPRDTIPEGIEADPVGGGWLTGSIHRRTILRVGRDGSIRELVAPAQDGLGAVLGLEVDRANGALWAAANASTHAVPAEPGARATLWKFDLRDGRTLARYEIPGEDKHLLNDVRVAANGVVFVTDSEGGMVWRLEPGATELSPVIPARTISYPNGIAVSRGGERLIVADWMGLWRIDVATGARERVVTPSDVFVGGIDGIERDGDRLYAVQNLYGHPRVIEVTLNDDWTEVLDMNVLASRDDRFFDPTTLALGDRHLWVLADTQLRRAERGGTFPPVESLRPPVIVEIERPIGSGTPN